jgi:hypothetical protein
MIDLLPKPTIPKHRQGWIVYSPAPFYADTSDGEEVWRHQESARWSIFAWAGFGLAISSVYWTYKYASEASLEPTPPTLAFVIFLMGSVVLIPGSLYALTSVSIFRCDLRSRTWKYSHRSFFREKYYSSGDMRELSIYLTPFLIHLHGLPYPCSALVVTNGTGLISILAASPDEQRLESLSRELSDLLGIDVVAADRHLSGYGPISFSRIIARAFRGLLLRRK